MNLGEWGGNEFHRSGAKKVQTLSKSLRQQRNCLSQQEVGFVHQKLFIGIVHFSISNNWTKPSFSPGFVVSFRRAGLQEKNTHVLVGDSSGYLFKKRPSVCFRMCCQHTEWCKQNHILILKPTPTRRNIAVLGVNRCSCKNETKPEHFEKTGYVR